MKNFVTVRLSTMMFLQFFIWGAWYVVIGNYMTAHGMGHLTFWPYTVNPIAAIIAPFFLGLIADRYFPTERVLGVLHLAGGIVMLFVPSFTGNPTVFILMLLLYNLCYMPTIGLTNSLAFHNIQNQEKQFPVIRVFGTIGWIIAGLFISFGLVHFAGGNLPDLTPLPLYATGVASLLLGLYSFTLPHTPPQAAGQPVSIRSIVGVDALKQLKSPSFFVFLLSSFLICIPLSAYYNFAPIFVKDAGFSSPAFTMSFGQMSEVVFMLLIPVFFARLGVKKMLLVGMGAWVLRYALFAMAAPAGVYWMIIAGILLHGICYDFFFVTGQIYVDKKSTPAIRGQAQGMLVLVTYGLGMLIGAQVAGRIYGAFLGSASVLNGAQWQNFWWLPAGFAAVILVFFGLAFREKVVKQ
ncbi:MAG: nucleoside permease [candidate division KSB1 bacterium]|nr:nucleoside permease [candidate division KSB1 bacterium]